MQILSKKQNNKLWDFFPFSILVPTANLWLMRWVLYPFGTAISQTHMKFFVSLTKCLIFSLPGTMPLTGLKPLTLVIMRQVFYHCATHIQALTWMLHWPKCPIDFLLLCNFLSLLGPMPAGLKPSTLRWWDECSTTVLLTLVMQALTFLLHWPNVLVYNKIENILVTFLSQVQRQLDLNPWSCEDEASILPLCYRYWSYKHYLL